MTKRIKVLHLQPKCDVRVSDLQEEIIKALPEKHFDVVTAYLTGNPEVSISGVHSQSERVKYFNFQKKEIKGLRISLMRNVWKFCQEENFDVVITHRFKAFDIILKLNKFLKIPNCIGIVHNLDDFNRFYRQLNSLLFMDKRWTAVGVSQAVNHYLLKIGYGFNKTNVVTINNAIDTEYLINNFFTREQAREKLGLDNEAFVFGTVGRMVPVKGHKYLIEAFAQLHKVYKNIRLIIIGDGKLKIELEELVNRKNLQDVVSLPGQIVDAKLLMPAFDSFVLSSLSEGLPLVVLEAMAAKLPVIATDVGGVYSALIDRKKLIPPKDIEQLYQAMKRLYDLSESERELLGNELHQFLIKNFDIKDYRRKYRELVMSKLSKEQKSNIRID